MELNGARTLLTGATGGIGQAIARAMFACGADMVLTGRRIEMLESLANEVGGLAVAADLGDRTSLQRLIEETGDIDVFISNAGLPASGLLTTFSNEEIDLALEVNLRAPIVTTRHVCEHMIARGSGHVVFVSSLMGKMTSSFASMYSATKFGIRGFSLAMREELRPSGIGVSTVFPGFVRDAGMFAESGTVLPRLIGTSTPEQVARAVIHAIQTNRAEVDVAPVPIRLSVRLASVMPSVIQAVQRRAGADKIAAEVASGQLNKRR